MSRHTVLLYHDRSYFVEKIAMYVRGVRGRSDLLLKINRASLDDLARPPARSIDPCERDFSQMKILRGGRVDRHEQTGFGGQPGEYIAGMIHNWMASLMRGRIRVSVWLSPLSSCIY